MSVSRIIAASAALALLSTTAVAGSSAKAKRPPRASEDGYYVPYVTGPGGQKKDVMEIPGSVSVVSRKFMDDVQATTIGDALRYVPGVTVGR
jgi:outer membrane receptor for ferric coprogen and ferric-rhodotorulic acid